MLRIQRDDVDAHRVILVLQGHIIAEWADLLERECAELSRSGFHVALDFSGVVFIGRSGFDALSRLSRAGVPIIGCSQLIADVLRQEGIAASGDFEDANDESVPGEPDRPGPVRLRGPDLGDRQRRE
jgi:anti-anti-sigma regulatory factor